MDSLLQKTILLVEDDVIIAMSESVVLKRFGYSVVNAYKGEEAVLLAENSREINLVLMDIDLGPGMDGTEAARQILARRDLPIIFLTSHSERSMVDKVKNITRYGYVIKNSGDFVLESSIEMAFQLFDAHQKTRQSERLYHKLTETMLVGVFRTDAAGNCTYVNQRWSEITGLAFDQALDQGWAEALHPDDRARVFDDWMSSVQRQQDSRIEYRYLRASKCVWVLGEAAVERDDAGQVVGYVGTITDITERKQTEEALHNSETHLNLAAKIAHLGVWDWDIASDRMEWNSEMYTIYGIEPAVFTHKAKDLFKFTRQDYKQIQIASVGEVFDRAITYDDLVAGKLPALNLKEICILRPNGSECFILEDALAIMDQNRQVQRVLGVVFDISNLKHLESTIQQSEQSLNELFMNHSAIMWLVNPEENTILAANRAAEKFYGYTREEFTKIPLRDITTMSREEIIVNNRSILDNQRPAFEVVHRLASGELRTMEIFAAPIFPGNDRVYFSILHDITGRKHIEKILHIQHDLLLGLSAIDNLTEALEKVMDSALQFEGIDSGALFLEGQTPGKFNLVLHRGLSKALVRRIAHFEPNKRQMQDAKPGKVHYELFDRGRMTARNISTMDGLMGVAFIPIFYGSRLVAYLFLGSHRLTEIPDFVRDSLETISLQIGSFLVRLNTLSALQRSKQDLQLLFNTIDDYLFVLDETGVILQTNDSACEYLGFRRDELEGQPLVHIHPPDRREEAAGALSEMIKGARESYVIPFQTRIGGLIQVETRASWGEWDGKPALVCMARDITARLRYEQEISGLLQEKEILLREVHHRIKNNMSTIASLLELQANLVTDPDAVQALQNSVNRVKSMMMIYAQLYQSSNIQSLDARQYLSALLPEIHQTLLRPGLDVEMKLDIAEIRISSRISFPLGIIINELVSNAFKYAYPNGGKGEIRVAFRQEDEASLGLCVANDGISMPDEVDVMNAETFGLSLVRVLTGQLNGSLSVSRGSGTQYHLVIPVERE